MLLCYRFSCKCSALQIDWHKSSIKGQTVFVFAENQMNDLEATFWNNIGICIIRLDYMVYFHPKNGFTLLKNYL